MPADPASKAPGLNDSCRRQTLVVRVAVSQSHWAVAIEEWRPHGSSFSSADIRAIMDLREWLLASIGEGFLGFPLYEHRKATWRDS